MAGDGTDVDALLGAAGANEQGQGTDDGGGAPPEGTNGDAGAGGGEGQGEGGGADDRSEDQRQESRLAYELRQARRQQDALKKELEGYKRRDEDARKATLTKEQQLEEEVKALKEQVEQEKLDKLRAKVAGEFRLPPALQARLIGSDEDSIRADAAELARLLPRPKVGNPTNPMRPGDEPIRFKRSQLRDTAFFKANEAAIRQAAAEGRIDEG